MSTGFNINAAEEVRAQLGQMSDAQLVEHGKRLRKFCRPRPGVGVDKGWLMQLNEARKEWRRRYPSTVRKTPNR